jgi:hypothetical protein
MKQGKRLPYRTPAQQVPTSAMDLINPDRVGRYPGCEEKAILDLATAYQYREDPRYSVVSWANQVKAYDVFAKGGLIAVLAELFPNG